MRRLIWLGTIALLLSPTVAWTQEPPAIVPGSRIRITELEAGKSKRRSGTVVTAGPDNDVLRLDGGGATGHFPLRGESGLEVSPGRKGHDAGVLGRRVLSRGGRGA